MSRYSSRDSGRSRKKEVTSRTIEEEEEEGGGGGSKIRSPPTHTHTHTVSKNGGRRPGGGKGLSGADLGFKNGSKGFRQEQKERSHFKNHRRRRRGGGGE